MILIIKKYYPLSENKSHYKWYIYMHPGIHIHHLIYIRSRYPYHQHGLLRSPSILLHRSQVTPIHIGQSFPGVLLLVIILISTNISLQTRAMIMSRTGSNISVRLIILMLAVVLVYVWLILNYALFTCPFA